MTRLLPSMNNLSASVGQRSPSEKHVINRLYEREFDFELQPVTRKLSYMLATVPRSGSTLCAIRLWQTGLLGAPMEYLNFQIIGKFLARLGYAPSGDGFPELRQIAGYWRQVGAVRTSRNGVFGYKMFMANFLDISRRYPSLLQEITPDFVIYLTRRDAVGQAISYSRALQSKTWFADVRNAKPVEYRHEHVKHCLDMVRSQNDFWEDVFATTNVTPIRIDYESLCASPDETLSHVMARMGLDWDRREALDIPLIRKQADDTSKAWRDAFLADEARASH